MDTDHIPPSYMIVPPRHRALWMGAIWTLCALSMLQMAYFFFGNHVTNNDFKHLWLGSRVLGMGGDPYDPALLRAAAAQFRFSSVNPFVYLPATGWALRPFSALSFPWASLLWFWLNFFAAWALVLKGPKWLRVEHPERATLAGAVFLAAPLLVLPGLREIFPLFPVYTPFMRQMFAGQMNIALMAGAVLSLGALIRGRDRTAGAILGCVAAFKIAPCFMIVVLFCMGRRRAAFWGAGVFAAINLLTVALYGLDVHLAFLPVLANMGYGKETWEDFYRQAFNQSFNSLFHHLLVETRYAKPWLALGPTAAHLATWVASLTTLAALGLGIMKANRRPYAQREWGELETTLFLGGWIAMLLLPSLMWDHYAVQTIPMLLWFFGSRFSGQGALFWIRFAAALFLLAFPWDPEAPRYKEGLWVLWMSLRLWGVLFLAAQMGRAYRNEIKERLRQASAA